MTDLGDSNWYFDDEGSTSNLLKNLSLIDSTTLWSRVKSLSNLPNREWLKNARQVVAELPLLDSIRNPPNKSNTSQVDTSTQPSSKMKPSLCVECFCAFFTSPLGALVCQSVRLGLFLPSAEIVLRLSTPIRSCCVEGILTTDKLTKVRLGGKQFQGVSLADLLAVVDRGGTGLPDACLRDTDGLGPEAPSMLPRWCRFGYAGLRSGCGRRSLGPRLSDEVHTSPALSESNGSLRQTMSISVRADEHVALSGVGQIGYLSRDVLNRLNSLNEKQVSLGRVLQLNFAEDILLLICNNPLETGKVAQIISVESLLSSGKVLPFEMVDEFVIKKKTIFKSLTLGSRLFSS